MEKSSHWTKLQRTFSKFFLLENKLDYLLLVLSTLVMFILFHDQVFTYLGHDEIPPYYSVAFDFYNAGPLQFLNILMHPSATFGHPFLFPMLLGLLMKVFGPSSLLAKIYIFIFSSFSIYALTQLARFTLNSLSKAILFVVLLLTTSMYYLNLPLLIGDTALLTLTLFYLIHLLKRNTKTVLVLAFVIGLTRESFMIFALGLFVAQFIFLQLESKKNLEQLKTIVLSLTSVTLWFIYNLIAEKKLLHTYASLNKDHTSYFDFSIGYFLQNSSQKFIDIYLKDPLVGVGLFFSLVLLFQMKKLSEIQKKILIYSFGINITTFVFLSFYHVFLDRYLLYGSYLLILNFIVFLDINIKNNVLYPLALTPLFFYFVQKPKYEELFYGKNVNIAHERTMKILEYLHEKREIDKPIIPCFPYNYFTLDLISIYPKHSYNFTNYNQFNIHTIIDPYVYVISGHPFEADAYYKKYFKNQTKEKILELGKNEKRTYLWKVYL